jgi:hypothetical protein
MSKETRTIRPFTGLGELPNVFDTAVLRFGSDACLANESITVDLTTPEFLAHSVALEWAPDAESFEQFRQRLAACTLDAGFELEHLAVVVIASSTFLKIADRVFTRRLPEIDGLSRFTDLVGNLRPEAFRAPFSGFAVDVFLVLTQSLPRRPLRPHQLGTWLARSQFRVDTTEGPASLPPTPLTDDIRQTLGLPAKTLRFLDFRDHDLLQPYGDQEPPVFYVDERLLAQMSARRNSAASKALQLQLAHDFVAAVVRRASSNPELTGMSYADLRTTLVGSVLRVAAGAGASDQDLARLLSDVRDTPERVIARAEHFIDVATGYTELLRDGDT